MLKYMTKYFDFDKDAVTSLIKAADGEEIPSTLEIKAKFTDETPDSHGDIITRSATERALPDYRDWRNIRYMHQPKAVGLAKHIGADDGADLNWNEVIIKLVDKDTIHQVQEGVLKGLSVGILFNPFDTNSVEITDDGNWKIKDYLLAEISVVDHPAHPNASVIEQSLSGFSEEKIKEITPELKTAIRSATSTEELVPLFKSLVVQEKEEDMKKEIQVEEEKELETAEKEGRDWDKERHMPENVVEPVEIEEESDEEEPVEEEVEEAVEEVEADEEEVSEDEELAVEEEVEEELEPEVEEDIELPEAEVEEMEEVEEPVSESEEVEEPVEEEEEVEEEEVVDEIEEVIGEEIESEQPLESNESEEKSITVNEDNVNARLERIEAMLAKLIVEDAEDSEAIEVEAEIETPIADEQEAELELAESIKPSNRKSNMNMSDGVEGEDEEVEKTFTFRRKRTDGQTRIRETLDKFKL